MKKFIKLHNTNDNSVILVNSESIIMFSAGVTIENKRFSTLNIDDNDIGAFDVNEVPEKIINNFDTGFIKLHDNITNNVEYVNIDFISLIDSESDGGSRIYIKDGFIEQFVVNETPEKIESMILKEENKQDNSETNIKK